MAGIDKIYGTYEQQKQLRKYLNNVAPQFLHCLYDYDQDINDEIGIRPISNFSTEADIFLWDNCPLPFVIERLKEQYNNEKPQ